MRGATLYTIGSPSRSVISIHAPHAGSDKKYLATREHFLISIHAPHAGSDKGQAPGQGPNLYFNPRSPCGERLGGVSNSQHVYGFQSTLPMRGATLVNI